MNMPRNPLMNLYKSRLYPNHRDIVALLFVAAVIVALAWNARQMTIPYLLGQPIPISLDPQHLPGYALRTVVRMLIALCLSLLFTFVFGTWAAKSWRARQLIIPAIDICQSIPVLTFLSVSIVAMISLFPGSMLGPECAAILAIFTSQAWNMTLGFYQTVRTVPAELHEAADMFHLSAWQRFWRIEVPFSMPGLLWNTMLSMSASWFFVVASEAISVANQEIMLPGMGSWIALAVMRADRSAILWAIVAMLVVILVYDQLLFRPLMVWAEKFRAEQTASAHEPRSWVIDLLRRTRLLRLAGMKIHQLMDAMINFSFLSASGRQPVHRPKRQIFPEKLLDRLWGVGLFVAVGAAVIWAVLFVRQRIPWEAVLHVFWLGGLTALRVFFCILLASCLWVPVGVWIGFRPRVAAIVQPVVQFLAAFPANLLYPVIIMMIVHFHLQVDIWVTLLMMLGVQWYVLFNIIAGASQIPRDLMQVVDNLGVTGWLRWRRLILPGILPWYVTGAMTAAGGAWNASIVAEVISWGNVSLSARGLGGYISVSTREGNFLNMALGVVVMCLLVLLFNYLVWRPLYFYTEKRFQLD